MRKRRHSVEHKDAEEVAKIFEYVTTLRVTTL